MDIFTATFCLYILALVVHGVYQIGVVKKAPFLEIGLHASFIALILRYSNLDMNSSSSSSSIGEGCLAAGNNCLPHERVGFLIRNLLAQHPILAIVGMVVMFISGFYSGNRWMISNSNSATSSSSTAGSGGIRTKADGSTLVAVANTKGDSKHAQDRQSKIKLKVQAAAPLFNKVRNEGNAANSSHSPFGQSASTGPTDDHGVSEYAPSVTSGDTDKHRKSEFNDQEFKETFEAAKKTVINIGNFTPDENVDKDTKWVLQLQSDNLTIWTAYSGTNGILLRGIATFGCDAYTLSKYLIDNNIVMGIEPIFQSTEVLHKTEDITVTRGFCKARAYYSSPRDFIIVSGKHESGDGGCIMASKSLKTDDKYSATKRRKGTVRGVLRGSGFIVRPKSNVLGTHTHNDSSLETEMVIGIHMSLEGSTTASTRQWNLSKSEIIVSELSNTVLKIRSMVDKTAKKFESSSGPDKRVLTPIRQSNPEPEIDGDLSSSQKDQLLSVVENAKVRMRELHDIILTNKKNADGSIDDSNTASNNVKFWETLYDQNGITVREQHPDAKSPTPLGVLNASCSIDAPLTVVQEKLMDQLNDVDGIDGLIEKKINICHLNSQVNIQWMAYRSMWPLGARDFLMITSNDTFESKVGECFTIVSTSIDDIGELEEPVGDKEYIRTLLKLAGYVGAPNSRGGTDLHLFLDISLSQYLPAWIIQMLAQYGLSEIMSRIRNAVLTHSVGRTNSPVRDISDPLLQASSAPPLNFPKLLSNIQHRENELKKLADSNSDGTDSFAQQLFNVSQNNKNSSNSSDTSSSNNSNKSSSNSSIAASTLNISSSGSSSGDNNSNSSSGSESTVVEKLTFPPAFDKFKPYQAPYLDRINYLAHEAIEYFQFYSGLKASPKLIFDWKQAASKKLATVFTSSVAGSDMCAIRCSAVIPNTSVVDILTLLLNDKRIKEYDDMVADCVFISNVNERTALRRMVMHGIWPTSPRDFLACTTWRVFPDGSAIIATRSPLDNSACQNVDGYVRGSIHVSGYLLQPSESVTDGSVPKGHVRLTLQAHSELGGSLPTSIINKLSSTAPMNIINTIADILSK